MKTWKLAAAEVKLSQVILDAKRGEPQGLTLDGSIEAVILSKAAYDQLLNGRPSFLQFMRASPFVGLDLEFERDKSPTREEP